MIAGLLGCVFGVLGILTSGLIFVPLAALCAFVGLLRGISGRSAAGVGTSLLAGVLSAIGFAVSPSLWLLAGGLLVASQADRTNATTDLAQSAPIARPQPIEAKMATQQVGVPNCDRLAGSPLDPQRTADGVPFEKMDTANAMLSCAQSVKENPTNFRFQYEYGRALDAAKRYDEAMRSYRAAADHGYSAAQVGLGFIYYNGHGVPQNYDEAMRWLRKAADQGNAVAENALGVIFINGQGVSQNYNEAMKWYRLAADHGFDMAQTNLGGMYYLGQGVAQNYSEAMKWYRKAADQGNADAQNTVGAMYESGHAVSQDYAEAAVWYRKAADQDNAVAQHNLGVLYRDGHGVAQNYAEAAAWFRRAADHGYVKAQHDLGALYYRGQGVETDLAEAFKWFRKAAEQGSPEDQNIIGGMYANGQGVLENYPEALRWLRLAADQGLASAQHNLAVISANGGELSARAGDFVGQLLSIWSASDNSQVTRLGDLYADRVSYYGKLTTRQAVIADKRKFAARWTDRRYELRAGSLNTNCDQSSSTCKVDGIVDWQVRSPTRGAANSGSARFSYSLATAGGTFVIISENSSVLDRTVAPSDSVATSPLASTGRAVSSSPPAATTADQTVIGSPTMQGTPTAQAAAPPSSLSVSIGVPKSWTKINSLTAYAKQIKHRWVKYGAEGNQTSYIDLASIIREGDTVAVLDMQDWNPPIEVTTTGEHLGSGLSLVRYDCGSTPRSMIMAGVNFHGNMGSGSPQDGAADTPKEPPDGWHLMQAGASSGSGMFKARDIACNYAASPSPQPLAATAVVGPAQIDNALAATLTDCDRQANEQVKRDDAAWTIGPHLPRQFDPLWTQHVNEIEQQRQQCRRFAETAAAQRAQEARDEERDREQGYPRISVETFALDGRDLAAHEAKVSLSGAYISDGNVGVLYADARAIIMATNYPNAGGSNQPRVPLLTDDASRNFRQHLIACQTNPASAQVGCPVTVLGHATMCKLSNAFGAERELPCVAVEDGR